MTLPPALARSRWQRVYDHLLFPLNIWLGGEASARLGVLPIDDERLRAALPYCRGRLLDVGCGLNKLVRMHGHGLGLDVHPYAGIDIQGASARLPFDDAVFDTVALLACLNHITMRRETLAECRRVLRRGGRVLASMIPPWVGMVSHPIRRRHDPDQLERGMGEEEEPGLSSRCVKQLLIDSGFVLEKHERFMWGLNNLYIARKP